MRLLLIAMILVSLKGESMQKATIGGGCFWCIEAVYSSTKGVVSAISGYSDGTTKDPTYEQVCDGIGGFAEVVQISYDEDIISYDKILDIFFTIHDPTTKDRQGNDIGVQYRSIILYHNDKQKDIAQKTIAKEQAKYTKPITTVLKPYKEFYKAEDYHQEYLKYNPKQPYCNFVVKPKVDKFKEKYKEYVK